MEISVVSTERGPRFLWIVKINTWGSPAEYTSDILAAPSCCTGEAVQHYRSDGTLAKSGTIRWDGAREEYMPRFVFGGGAPYLKADTKQFSIGDKIIISPLPEKTAGLHFELRLWIEMTLTNLVTSGVFEIYDYPPDPDEAD